MRGNLIVLFRLLLLIVLFFSSACSSLWSLESPDTGSQQVIPTKSKPSGVGINTRLHRRPGRLGPSGGVLGLNERFQYPEVPRVHHPEVKRFLTEFTGSKRSYVQEALGRREKYIRDIERILSKYGLPKELSNIAFIESRFKPDARYKDGSTIGLWQLSGPTAKNYGLRTGGQADDRKNVILSTEAAAKFLASLYDTFGDWYLAAAAYNSGPVRVQKALKSFGQDEDIHRLEFFELTSRGILSQTTREFVAKLGALIIITDNLEAHGFCNAKERC